MRIGADYQGDKKCVFTVWSPETKAMTLELVHPTQRSFSLQKNELGYFHIELDDIDPGTQYWYVPDGKQTYPDPASYSQPDGVHGPSEVVDHASYAWKDDSWHGIPFAEAILYELHIGTFTPEGTFESAIPRLQELADLGINAIEMMPIGQFPGERNWGYDGTFPYAPQHSYGGPEGLKKFIDACHAVGIAVYLDVVYNHLGPEGNYLSEMGPYFTEKYHTPWGSAFNFDDSWSDGVREFFAENAVYWLEVFHFDGLRFDAIHAVFDQGAVSFWEFMYEKVEKLEQKLGRKLVLIAESDLNNPRILKRPQDGGLGFTAQWLDDFHHALYAIIDEKEGKQRYGDFGRMDQVAKAYTDGFVFSGEYASFRKRKFGRSSVGYCGDNFIVFIDNHDQAGNRLQGERLSVLIDDNRLKVASAAIILAPYIPMLFMGEEFAADTPFNYFISHTEEELIKMVQEGRKNDFKSFNGNEETPDPQEEQTYRDSVLNWDTSYTGRHGLFRRWYKELIQLRKSEPIFQNLEKKNVKVQVLNEQGLLLIRQDGSGQDHIIVALNISNDPLDFGMPSYSSFWTKLLDSEDENWTEKGHPTRNRVRAPSNVTLRPWSVVVFKNES